MVIKWSYYSKDESLIVCERYIFFSFREHIFVKWLTALLGYLNVLLEYINPFHSFRPHSNNIFWVTLGAKPS